MAKEGREEFVCATTALDTTLSGHAVHLCQVQDGSSLRNDLLKPGFERPCGMPLAQRKGVMRSSLLDVGLCFNIKQSYCMPLSAGGDTFSKNHVENVQQLILPLFLALHRIATHAPSVWYTFAGT